MNLRATAVRPDRPATPHGHHQGCHDGDRDGASGSGACFDGHAVAARAECPATAPERRRPRAGMALVAVVLGLSLSACAPQYRNHGYTPSDAELSEIVVGVDTRDSVAESVGAPTSSGLLAGSDYYYVSSRVRHFGAAAPKEVERKLVAISFDNGGVVRNIETYALEDGQVVPLTRRVTDTGIADKSFLRQLLGNLGGFRPGGGGI